MRIHRLTLIPALCLAMAALAGACTARGPVAVSSPEGISNIPAVADDAGAAARAVARPVAFHRVAGNVVQNSSFEHNWFNRDFAEQRRFLLLQMSDMGVGEADGHIDHWRLEGVSTPEAWDTSIARSGSRSIRLTKGAKAHHMVRYAGEQNWREGGSQYTQFLPLERGLAAQVARRPIVVGAWCKTEGVPAGAEPHFAVGLQFPTRQGYEDFTILDQEGVRGHATFSAGTHDWEYREVRIDPAQLTGAPFFVTIILYASSQGGTTWFDDVSCVDEPSRDQPNRLANAGFEAADPSGWPEGWEKPAQWTWFRNTYYLFTGWSHVNNRETRGSAGLDPLLSFGGGRSLRLTVFPGDNLAVQSAPIILNQDRPRSIEARAMVKADRLRALEIMAQDETGQWLPQGDFLGDDMENNPGTYNMGTTGSGTYDWYCVRKYFSPRKPVKSLRLFLCARGFDGVIVEKNLVGTVWFDDVQLFEHGVPRAQIPAASVPVQPKPAPGVFPLKVVDIDLGDRLWGKNAVQVVMELPEGDAGAQAAETTLRLQLTDPAAAVKVTAGKAVVVPARTGASRKYLIAGATYQVEKLCRSWKEQYRLALQLVPASGGKPSPALAFPFGTPSRLLSAGVSAYYAYPEEPVTVYASVNVARDSFPDLARCEVLVNSGGKEKKAAEVREFVEILRPQRAPRYIDTSRLVQARLAGTGLTVHPWNEPVRDNEVSVRLYRKAGSAEGAALLAQSDPLSFGFMTRVPRPDLPPEIRKTAINSRGFITVNDQVYFPVYWTPHFGMAPEANYPPTILGFKTVDLTQIVYSKGKAPDAEVKARLLAKVAEVKNDPKFFQYELGEGEMQLQGFGWKERCEWLKTAIGWIREADPNHLINGPQSWLVGHPGHNQAMPAFIPHWDAIGVETSFEQLPRIAQVAKPLMQGRKTAVLVGLETYFYQPNETLRWRGYSSLLEGAAGIGLCPSGMLQARPDKENFLRGLNAEFRGLAPIITAEEPPDRISCSSSLVQTMERVLGGKRYLFAVRGSQEGGPLKVRFSYPSGTAYAKVRAMFEGRKLTPAGSGFEDDFPAPKTVHVYELER
jgi:hypothetical protein